MWKETHCQRFAPALSYGTACTILTFFLAVSRNWIIVSFSHVMASCEETIFHNGTPLKIQSPTCKLTTHPSTLTSQRSSCIVMNTVLCLQPNVLFFLLYSFIGCTLANEESLCHDLSSFLPTFGIVHLECFVVGSFSNKKIPTSIIVWNKPTGRDEAVSGPSAAAISSPGSWHILRFQRFVLLCYFLFFQSTCFLFVFREPFLTNPTKSAVNHRGGR